MRGLRVAFYAPLKPPSSPRPSGDRRLARLLMQSLQQAGNEVAVASDLRTFDGSGDADRQQQLRQQAHEVADQLLTDFRKANRPDIWFSYHLYHKAPDWIGPRISAELGIPYVVAEASFAPKQAGGPWQLGHQQVAKSIAAIDGLIVLNPVDLACVTPLMKADASTLQLPALVDTGVFKPTDDRQHLRQHLATLYDLDPAKPWLISVGMMRSGDKQRSFEFLSQALRYIETANWQLIIVGDGETRSQIESAFSHFNRANSRVTFTGAQDSEQLARLYNASDIMVWPAINEAIGMAMLEAQACAVPVVAADSGAVATVVEHQHSGFVLPEVKDAKEPEQSARVHGDFATSIKTLIDDPPLRKQFGDSAVKRIQRKHSINAAANALDRFLKSL